MGLFSSKKIVTVSSTLYNMAGDEDERPDFLSGTIFGSVMANAPSLADDLTGAYFNGPGQKQLQFFRYCQQTDYSIMPTASVTNSTTLDASVIAGEINVSPSPAGLQLSVYNATISDGDFEKWIQKWILENHPERIGEDWLGEYEPATNTFSVEFPNNDFFSWLNDGSFGPVFDPTKRYIVALYSEYLETSEDPVVEGTSTTGVTSLPDVSNFTLVSDTETSTPVTLVRNRTTTLSYSNGDPDVIEEDNVSANVASILNTAEEVYLREVTTERNGIEVKGERRFWNFTGTDTVVGGYSNTVVTTTDIGGGVIETRTEVTTGQQVQEQWTTQFDTQKIYIGRQVGNDKVFFYRLNTGNAILDALVADVDASNFQEFFPFVPIRIKNTSINEPQYSDLLAENEGIYRRAFPGKNFNSLVETIEDHESIDDIDYAYLCWGVSLNTKENTGKLYIYDFFKKMIPFQASGSGNALSDMQAHKDAYEAALAELAAWEAAYDGLSGDAWDDIPPRPTVPNPPGEIATNSIELRDSTIGIDYRLHWVHIEEEQFNGTFEVVSGIQSKIKDCKLVKGAEFTYEDGNSTNRVPTLYIYRQIDANTYRRLAIYGLVSQNYIYDGKAVKISSNDALDDEDESGFLVPLHYPTMLEMSIIDYTQLCTANSHILFNSYEVTKQKWWQRGIFKILLVIAIIVIAVVAFPGAFAGGAGILGGNLAVGAALGLTGTAALVAGVVANYVASILIAQVLTIVGTEIFGEKWGPLFGALASFAIGMAISGTSLFSAEGLLGLGNAIANGYSGWVQGDIAEMQDDLDVDRSDYEEKLEYIQNLIDDLDGESNLNFNPMSLTRAKERGNSRGYLPETADQYIRRTTMTGSDIVQLTHDMVYEYTNIARTLPRN